MAVRKVIKMGHPTLRKVAQKIPLIEISSKEIQELIVDLKETMVDYGGIGIAAPQVNVSIQLAIIEVPKDSDRYPDAKESETYIIINPEMEYLTDQTKGYWEGCLSVPGIRGYVERPQKIKLSYYDEQGQFHQVEIEGFLAVVFQHELDHLFGKLFIDRVQNTSLLAYEDELDLSGSAKE